MKINLENNWKQKSIENLEKKVWKSNDFVSSLVKKCSELRKQPLEKLTIEDIRLLIGQEIGLDYLVPLSIEILSKNIFAEGDLYEGDLLSNILNIEHDFWKKNNKYWEEINILVQNNKENILLKKIDTKKFEPL